MTRASCQWCRPPNWCLADELQLARTACPRCLLPEQQCLHHVICIYFLCSRLSLHCYLPIMPLAAGLVRRAITCINRLTTSIPPGVTPHCRNVQMACWPSPCGATCMPSATCSSSTQMPRHSQTWTAALTQKMRQRWMQQAAAMMLAVMLTVMLVMIGA